MKLNFKKFGDQGETVIILHGLFGMLDNWKTFARKLATIGYQVYILDQRNHGRSDWTEEMTLELMANDLVQFCEFHKLNNVHLIGHSMGGKVAMQACLTDPHLYQSQTIIDIVPKTYQANHNMIFDTLRSFPFNKIRSRSEAEAYLLKSIDEIDIVKFLLKNLVRHQNNDFKFKMNLEVLFSNYSSILKGMEETNDLSFIPSLFIKGSLSNYIMEEDSQLIDAIFPNNRIEIIEEAGHWVHADQPDKLLEVLTDFLDG